MKRIQLLFLIALAIGGCRKPAPVKDTTTKPAVARVQVQEVTPQVWHQTIRTFGQIEAAEKVTISAEVSGKVKNVFFEEGDKITAGQKLVTFDVSESRMRLKQAEGNLQGIAAQLKESKDMLSRREDLFKQRSISKEQLESARTSVATLEAQYGQLVAGRSLAKHHMRRTQLQSPVSGTVFTKGVNTGEVAMPGQALAVIHVTDTMRVVTWVTQEEINTVRTGAPCTVETNGVRGRVYDAHVESAGNEADPVTGNFPVKLTVNNSDGLLKVGMSAVISLTGMEVTDAILIPDSAVFDRNRKRVVYLVQDGKAKEVEPVLAATSDAIRPVLHGISPGDKLIVGGLDDVADGSAVQVIGTVPFATEVAVPIKNKNSSTASSSPSTTPASNNTDADTSPSKQKRGVK